MRRFRRRTALLAAAAVAVWFVGTITLGATAASADPSAAWELSPTAGIQFATDANGVRYPYIVMPTGGRWYLECPMEIGPNTHALRPSIALNVDRDRCGNDQGSTHSYEHATWQTSLFASVNVDPADVRCGQLVAHRADAIPPDAVSPVFCTDRPLIYPTLNTTLAHQLATWWPDNVFDTCPAPTDRSSLACGPKDDGKPPTVAFQWWHGDGHGGVDCARVPTDHLPNSIATWAAGDPARLTQACQLLNNYLVGAPLAFTPTTDMLSAVRQALQESGPGKQPPWTHAARGKDVKVSKGIDWQGIAGLVGGCLGGGALGAFAGGPFGLVIGCGVGGAIGTVVANWLEGKDCALTSWHCIVNATSRWMANGLVDELKFALNQLVHGLDPSSLFGKDIFVRLWLALALISALLATLYTLLSLGVSVAVLRPSIAMTSVRNIAIWGWGLAVAIPFTRLILSAVDGLTTTITTVGAGVSWTDLASRFQSTLSAALTASLPSTSDATVSVLLFLMLIVGGIAALFLAAYALGRSAGIALATLGIPIALAGITGPPVLRRGPQMALATLFGLILFKPLVAVVFLLGIGLMGTGGSLAAFMVGLLCVLGAAFAPWKIIRLFGAGLDHVSHGAAGHTAVVAGAVATASGARVLYQRSRGLWHPSGTGSGRSGPSPSRAVTAASATATQFVPPAPATRAPNRTPPYVAPPPRVAHSPGTADNGQPRPQRTSGSDIVTRQKGTDK